MSDRIQIALATFVVASGSNSAVGLDHAVRQIDQFIDDTAAAGEDPLRALRSLEDAYLNMKSDGAAGKAIQSALRQRIGLMIISARSDPGRILQMWPPRL